MSDKPREFWIAEDGPRKTDERYFFDNEQEANEKYRSFYQNGDRSVLHLREVLEPSPSQDEFDEKAAAAEVDLWVNKLFPMSFHDTERADAAFIGLQMAHWQFNQMKRKSTEGGKLRKPK